MPPSETMGETPPRRVMRQWFQGKIGERLLQAGQMAKDRAMLRHGALKQQNGTLGKPDEGQEAKPMADAMTISVGDTVNYHEAPAPPPVAAVPPAKPSGITKTLGKAAIMAALVGSGVGVGAAIPWMLGLLNRAPVPAVEAPVDRDTIGNIVIE